MKITLLLILTCVLMLSCENREVVPFRFPLESVKPKPMRYVSRAKPGRIFAKPQMMYDFRKYDNLSDQFNLRISMAEIGDFLAGASCNLKIEVFTKQDSVVQTIKTDAYAFGPVIIEYSLCRSYEKKVNLKKELADPEYHGEIIVGDFNFDSLSDIAVVSCIPMSGTPTYKFYLQNENFEFVQNAYFSDVVQNLPQKLNPKNKTFMAYYHTGCCAETYRYFKVDGNGKCRLVCTKET